MNDLNDFQPSPPVRPWLLLVLLIGIGFRLVYSWYCYVSNFDTGTVGLMAVNILDGERPLFFYGQNYMGALEAYVGAISVAIFGPTDFAISLSTILFAGLWMMASYLLFRDLGNRVSGLIAALLVAVPGYWIIKYSVSPYGGYTIAFFCGTLALWLAVRLVKTPMGGGPLILHCAGMGLLGGIGLWTHYLVAPYLAVAGILCLVILIRHPSGELMLAYGLGGCLALLGLVPAFLVQDQFTGNDTAVSFSFAGDHLGRAWDVFRKVNVPRLVSWDMESVTAWLGTPLRLFNGVVLATGFILYLAGFSRRAAHPLLHAVPLLFLIIFSLLFFPHSMSEVEAPRYMISAWIFFLGAALALGWGSNSPGLTIFSGIAILGFALSQLAGQGLYFKEKRPVKTARAGLYNNHVQFAREAKTDVVEIVGGPIEGHDSQILSFHAANDPRFVSVYDERHQGNAQAAETTVQRGWTGRYPIKVRQAFWDLQLSPEETGTDAARTFYGAKVQPWSARALRTPKENCAVDLQSITNGPAQHVLNDRSLDSSVEIENDLLIDLGEVKTLCGIWLFSPDAYQNGLPRSFQIFVTERGDQPPQKIIDSRSRIADAYISGPTVFFKGYFSKWEVRFPPVRARWLRIARHNLDPHPHQIWNLAEVVVFESTRAPDGLADMPLIAELARKEQLDFVVADRWHSARLLEELGAGSAYPRYNPKHRATLISRTFLPRKGLGLLINRALYHETIRLLQRAFGDCFEVVTESGDQVLLKFKVLPQTQSRLVWNGHMLLESTPGRSWH